MKKCLLCGTIDEAGTSETCPMDGEATWQEIETVAEVIADAVEPAGDDAPKKRGRK